MKEPCLFYYLSIAGGGGERNGFMAWSKKLMQNDIPAAFFRFELGSPGIQSIAFLMNLTLKLL